MSVYSFESNWTFPWVKLLNLTFITGRYCSKDEKRELYLVKVLTFRVRDLVVCHLNVEVKGFLVGQLLVTAEKEREVM